MVVDEDMHMSAAATRGEEIGELSSSLPSHKGTSHHRPCPDPNDTYTGAEKTDRTTRARMSRQAIGHGIWDNRKGGGEKKDRKTRMRRSRGLRNKSNKNRFAAPELDERRQDIRIGACLLAEGV